MPIQVFPVPVTTSGDPASRTFPATAAGTYTMGYTLSAGVYEITTDTVQSSHTITFETAVGYRYSGTVRGGKGYVSVASDVTKIIIPSGLTYPINYNIRLGGYTQIAAPSAVSASFSAGNQATFTFTAPSGATNITAFWTNGTSTSFASTSSPRTSVTIPTAVDGQTASAMLIATDANGVLGAGSLVTTSNTANVPISGGESAIYTSGGTSYLSLTFLASGTLTVNRTSNIEYFIVGGGGPGGWNDYGGGGGGGGTTSGTQTSVSSGNYTVTVGAGGAAASAINTTYGTNGATSSIAFSTTRSANGGGAGGMYKGVDNSNTPGVNGGCGGGGGMGYGASNLSGGTATSGQGNNGGSGQNYSAAQWQGGGGGGGGGGAAGGNAVTGQSSDGGNGNAAARAGAGGNGISNSFRTGSAITYAGGGGGRSANPTFGLGAGGTGGGTAAGSGTSSPGGQNLGGGSGATSSAGSPGGSGIVIVRVAI